MLECDAVLSLSGCGALWAVWLCGQRLSRYSALNDDMAWTYHFICSTSRGLATSSRDDQLMEPLTTIGW